MNNRQPVRYCQWAVERIPPPNFSERKKRDFISAHNHQIRFILRKGITSFGRVAANDVPVESILASRKHCSIILKEDGSLFIRDHRSLNGIYLNDNDKTILEEREISLGDGDVFGLGVMTTMDDFDPENPPKTQYIFQITRKIVSQEELPRRNFDTIVPVLEDGYMYRNTNYAGIEVPPTFGSSRNKAPLTSDCADIIVPSTSSCATIGVPSTFSTAAIGSFTSVCADNAVPSTSGSTAIIGPSISGTASQNSTEKTIQNSKGSINVKPMKSIKQKMEIIELSDSNDDEEEETPVDAPIVVPDKESNSNPDVITIECDNDVRPPQSIEILHSKKTDSSILKTVRTNEKNKIFDEELVKVIKKKSTLYKEEGCNDKCTIKTASPISTIDSEKSKVVELRNENDQDGSANSPQSDKDKNLEIIENDTNKETAQVEIEEEKLIVIDEYTIEDDVILIEDDDGELPCSQLFDVKENIEETNDDTEELCSDVDNVDMDCWTIESDSESESEVWFQRLSQSNDQYNSKKDEDEESGQEENETICNNVLDEPAVKDSDGFVLQNQTVDKRISEDESEESNNQFDVTDDSEAIFRKVPPARKRKLSDSSEEDIEDNALTAVERHEADITDTSKTNKHSKPNHLEDSIDRRKVITSSSSRKKNHKKKDELEISKYNKITSHKKTHLILNEDNNRLQSQKDKLTDKSSDSISRNYIDVPSLISKRVKTGQTKITELKRKRSTDTDSSQSPDASHSEVHSTTDSKVTSDSDDEWWRVVDIVNEIDKFVDIHGSSRKEDRSLSNCQDGFSTRTRVVNDIEELIRPSKIVKSSKPKLSSEKNPEDSCGVNMSHNKTLLSPVGKQFESNSYTKTTSQTNNIANLSAVVQPIQEGSEAKKLDKEHPVTKTSKLSEVSKKINASHKRKTIPIIEAKSIRTKRKSVNYESKTFMKKDDQTHENKPEQWLSNNKAIQSKAPLSKTDTKALRKEKLKDLAMKGALENKQQEKSKIFKAKNKTKSTSKSRNDMFVQDLVSCDIEQEKSEKPQKDAPLSLYKIPRRPSSTEDNIQTIETLSLKESKQESTPQLTSVKSFTKSISDKEMHQKPSNPSPIDQIIKVTETISNNSIPKDNKPQVKTYNHVVGIENEEPIKVIKLNEEEYNLRFKGSNTSIKQKSSIKISPTPRNHRKKTKFNFVNDDKNVVYIVIREFEVDQENKLKPVTRSVSKERDSAKKQSHRKIDNRHFVNYREETLYTVCNWNCMWFEEKNDIQKIRSGSPKDPPVFSGQMYHLTGEFSDYNDYRRGIFPLLVYELWGSVARQYDMVYIKQNNRTNPLYNLDIKDSKTVKVTNVFVQTRKNPSLQHLHCQVLLDRKQQDVWPRPGDLVVLSLIFIQNQRMGPNGKLEILKGGERRIFGYVTDCPPPKSLEFHPDVSPRLREQSPNANMVMDGLNIVIRGDRGQQINIKQGVRFKVLKNIKSDLRAFEALDYLPVAQLSRQIYQPRENCPRHNLDEVHAIQPLVDHLNESQKQTVLKIAKECIKDTTMIHLVHGPPGCGKSEVIINIILQMWYDYFTINKTTEGFPQILICTPSNLAIDDIVSKLVNRKNTVLDARGIPQFGVIRVASLQSSEKSCSHLTLDYLARKEMKRLKEGEDGEEKRIELQCLEAKKHQLSQKLDSLDLRRTRNNKSNETSILGEIREVGKKLAETKERIKFLESGKQKSDQRAAKLEAAKFKEIQLELLQKATVVGTTLSSCYNGIMAEAYSKRFIKFDCCIVDEATQCIEPDTLIPLMLGVRKLVLVGDPKQLPATVLTGTAKVYGLEKSLFSRHYDWWTKDLRDKKDTNHPCHFLNTQYRMHPEIAQWPSQFFYDNKLRSAESLVDRIPNCPLAPYTVLSHCYLQSAEEGECNVEEGRLVATLVRGITSHCQCQGLSIGIITPYNRQKEELKRRIGLREFPNVEVGTVDSYQGREQDIVIFSCVRTEGIGFLGGPERLNVALTRAKHCLIVIGNFKSLQMDQTWKSLLNDARKRNVLKPIVNNQSIMSLILKPVQRENDVPA